MPDLKTETPYNEFQAGGKMPDGTIHAGLSPDTRRTLYVMPADAAQIFTWKNAILHAAKLDAHGHRDWRVPTLNELDLLFQQRALIGGFSMTGWYWSSLLSSHGLAWVQRFSDGHQFSSSHRIDDLFLRCVRG
jgi:hypothetical protein